MGADATTLHLRQQPRDGPLAQALAGLGRWIEEDQIERRPASLPAQQRVQPEQVLEHRPAANGTGFGRIAGEANGNRAARQFGQPVADRLGGAHVLAWHQGVLDAGQLAEEPRAARHHEDIVGQFACAGHHTPATVGDLLHRALVPGDAMPGKKPSQWHMEVRCRAQARRNPDQARQVGQRILRRDHHDLGIDALPPQLANGREAREAAADNGNPGHGGVLADMARKVSHIRICVNKKL